MKFDAESISKIESDLNYIWKKDYYRPPVVVSSSDAGPAKSNRIAKKLYEKYCPQPS